MKIKMKLLSDTIFGNGVSVPGEEDISVLCDDYGFPYYKGGTFKGIVREEMLNYLGWMGRDTRKADALLGKSGDSNINDNDKLVFSDFHLSGAVKRAVLDEVGDNPQIIRDAFTNIRAFTEIDRDGIAEDGSLRLARCVNKELIFYSDVKCPKEDEKMLEEVLALVKWIGSMRNRGFGKVEIKKVEA